MVNRIFRQTKLLTISNISLMEFDATKSFRKLFSTIDLFHPLYVLMSIHWDRQAIAIHLIVNEKATIESELSQTLKNQIPFHPANNINKFVVTSMFPFQLRETLTQCTLSRCFHFYRHYSADFLSNLLVCYVSKPHLHVRIISFVSELISRGKWLIENRKQLDKLKEEKKEEVDRKE